MGSGHRNSSLRIPSFLDRLTTWEEKTCASLTDLAFASITRLSAVSMHPPAISTKTHTGPFVAQMCVAVMVLARDCKPR